MSAVSIIEDIAVWVPQEQEDNLINIYEEISKVAGCDPVARGALEKIGTLEHILDSLNGLEWHKHRSILSEYIWKLIDFTRELVKRKFIVSEKLIKFALPSRVFDRADHVVFMNIHLWNRLGRPKNDLINTTCDGFDLTDDI